MTMQVAIIGSTGQLGFELQQTQPEDVTIRCFDRQTVDLTRLSVASLEPLLTGVDCIINAAAYTAVDQAETDNETAYQVNALAVNTLASFSHKYQVPLIHVSTDFVFAGHQASPYRPDDTRAPQSVYGASKAQGEVYLYKEAPQATCIRTSWVYSQHGNNFVKTMLKLMNDRDTLSVVADQIGSPTWANDLATFVWLMVKQPAQTIVHYSNEGVCSWYDFACAIYTLGQQKGLIKTACDIRPIATADYPTPAKRPAYSLLDKTQTRAITQAIPHWLHALDRMLDQITPSH